MRSKVILIKSLGVALVGGAVLFGLFSIIAGTRYSPYLITYLDPDVNIAVFSVMIAFTAVAALGGVVLLRSKSVKTAGIPFILLFAFITTAGPIAGFTIVETQVIKGEIDLNRIGSLYSTQAEWEARAATIRQGILKGAELVPLPTRTPLNAVNHSLRTYVNYSVENVYFESLPGFFIAGNLYRPAGPGAAGLHPAMLVPHGHHNHDGHFEEEIQNIAADFARLGANVFTWDMIGYGESPIIVHESSHALSVQLWNSMRVLDFMLSLNDTDASRVGMTGASGGGTQTFLLAAVDGRVNISAPVVMVSSYVYGGSLCEDGMPVHEGEGYATNNAEIAALHAPRPMLLISDGDDWTRLTPTLEYPFIQRIYGFYGATGMVENVHFANERHDYGPNKRDASLRFFASHFALNVSSMGDDGGRVDESPNVIETINTMKAFTLAYPRPAGALVDEESVLVVMRSFQPGWQPNNPTTVGDPMMGLLTIITCVVAVLAIAASRRKIIVE
jgi:hypothetical protein